MLNMKKAIKEYDTLIITGIGPASEQALDCFLNEQQQIKPLIFRCEEVYLWDPYDSFTRSIIGALVRYPSISDIIIIANKAENENSFSIVSETVNNDCLSTATYLINHLSPITAKEWFSVRENECDRARKTAALLQNHPFLPRPVKVKVMLVEQAKRNGNTILQA